MYAELDYRTFVLDSIKSCSQENNPNSKSFGNRGPENSSSVIEAIMRQSKVTLDIMTDNLNQNIFNLDILFEQLKKHETLKVRILFESSGIPNHTLLKKLTSTELKDRISLRILTKEDTPDVNVTIGDNKFCRIVLDKDEMRCRVAFNKDNLSTASINMFNRFWKASIPLDVQ